jgi:hypothetical protein
MTTAPPSPTTADARRVRALARAVAKVLRRDETPSLSAADTAWMEARPQSLPLLLDAAVAAITAGGRDEELVIACRWLLANQLELIRYRLERGHGWARAMLDAHMEQMIALARDNTLPETDWFALVALLNDAKVPIPAEMAEALAAAVAEPTHGKAPSPQDGPREVRDALDTLARSADDAFMVVEQLAETGTLIPPERRAYLTHELGLSPHAMLREAVPLLLLDPQPAVRRAAAAVLEQVAGTETVSPEMLRRILLVRNWVPEAEREAVDRLARKVRLKGVACAQWPPAPTLEIHCSIVDGSGAQSLLITTPARRAVLFAGRGLFAGLLLKQGFGVRDAWCGLSVPRRDIARSLKEVQREVVWFEVGRDHLDVVVQHHIARGLAMGNLPLAALIAVAEAVGAADWKDRSLDVAAETERLFAALGPAAGAASAVTSSLQRSGRWLAKDPMMRSWLDDDAEIRTLADGRPRPKRDLALRRMLEEVLPARREAWAERLLLLALWLRAAAGNTLPAERYQDSVVLARELIIGRPLAELPAMVAIAERSLTAAGVASW